MSTQGGEFIATDKPTGLNIESSFDAIMMEDSQSDGCPPNATDTNRRAMGAKLSARPIIRSKFAMFEAGPRPQASALQRQPGGNSPDIKYKIPDPVGAEVADLV